MEYKKFKPLSFNIMVKGNVNNTPLVIEGNGVVSKIGVYEATLNFNALPPNFHPSAIATYLLSICCYYVGAMRNRGINISSMGANSYSTKRILTFKNGKITIKGNIDKKDESVKFTGSINGKVKLPNDLAGNSIYIKRIDPKERGIKLIGIGEGSLFRINGQEIPMKIHTIHNLKTKRLRNPLRNTQFRIVTENGELIGKTYRAIVCSILDGNNTMGNVLEM
jgi:hypothetical protein